MSKKDLTTFLWILIAFILIGIICTPRPKKEAEKNWKHLENPDTVNFQEKAPKI